MKDSDRSPQTAGLRKLAEDVTANIPDLLRIRSAGKESARMFRDSRLMRWLAGEARAVVRDGLELDPWSADDVNLLAERMRAAVVADRSGVRRLSGRPTSAARPEIEHGPCEPHGPMTGKSTVSAPIPWVQLATAAGVGRELWDEECDTWISLPPGLPAGNYVALNVKGESMVPLLHDGDVVLVNMSAVARPGDIVLARTGEGHVVKRLARINTAGVVLESLNREFDPITIADQQRPIVGVVVLRWCEHQRGSVNSGG